MGDTLYSVAMLLTNPFDPDPRVYKEALSLVQSGYEVNIICWDRSMEYKSKERLEGINIIRIQLQSRYSFGSQQIFFLPRFWWQALKLLREIKPDIIHCHDLDTAPIGYIYYLKKHIPWIFDAHECYPEQIRPQVNTLVYRLLIYLERYITPRASHVITVGERLAQRLTSLGGQVSIIGNYPNKNLQVSCHKISRSSLGINEYDFVVAYIGGFTLAREILPLIHASKLYPEASYLIIGDGPQRNTIEASIYDYPRVRYLGKVPQQDISRYITLVNVIYYGLSNDSGNSYYSAPNALFGAMAAGKPIITTNTGEISQVVREEQCGVVIENPEPGEIAQAIEKFRFPALYDRLARNALNAARDKYNWDLAQDTLLEVYRNQILVK